MEGKSEQLIFLVRKCKYSHNFEYRLNRLSTLDSNFYENG